MAGYTQVLLLGRETVYGSAVARTIAMRVLSMDLHQDPMFEAKSNGSGAGAPMERTQALDRETSGGSITVEAAYDDGTAFLLAYWLGCIPAEGGGGGPTYTHTYTLLDQGSASFPIGMTMEAIGDILASTIYADVFEGGVCPGGTLTIPETGPATLQMDIIAETAAARTTAGTPTYHTGEPTYIRGWHGGNLAWNSLAGKVKSIAIEFRLNLERRWVGGSRYTIAPRSIGSRYTCKIKVTREYDENTMKTAYLAGTQADGTITFSGPSSQTLAFTFQNAQCTQYSDPSTKPGINDQTFELTCHSDNTDKGLQVVLTNTQSVYTAN